MKYRKRRFVAEVESIEGRLLLSTAPQFTVKDLGVVYNSYPITGINSSGQVIGTMEVGNIRYPFVSGPNGGAITPILDLPWATANGINDLGQITGDNGNEGFIYSNGQVTNIPATTGTSVGYDINNSGNISGVINSQGAANVMFYDGTVHDIEPHGLGRGNGLNINNSGQVTGWAEDWSTYPNVITHAFLSDPNGGAIHYLGAIGDLPSWGLDVNDNGQVAGSLQTPDGGFHAFVSDANGGSLHDLGVLYGLPGINNSQANGINNLGETVGYNRNIVFNPYGTATYNAFVDINGLMYNLNNQIPSNSGFTLTDAEAINDNGQIAVVATDSSGQTHALLLTPVPPAPVAPTITWANPADIVYGTPLSATQLNATASVPGTFTYSVAAGTVLHAGAAQVIQATFTPDDLVHYTTATAEALINVTKRPIIVYANPVTKVYGAPVPDGSFYYTGWNNQQGFVNGDTPQSIGLNPVLYSAGTVNASTPVGVYNAFPLVSNMFDDYTVSTGGTTITITPAPLTVTANNAQVHYGFTIPPLTGTITGLVNGDTDVATYTTTAVQGSWAGYYPIVPHLTDSNYNITFVNGTLTIYWSVPPGGF